MHLAACTLGVLYRAFAQSEQGVVLAATHILTGVDARTALTNQNVARTDELTCEALATKTLGLGIAAVADGTLTFLVCDEYSSLTMRCW